MPLGKDLLESAEPPWGKWEVLLSEPGYKVKRITVNPGHKLSYQRHANRQEHWVAVAGNGIIILNDKEIALQPGEAVDCPVNPPVKPEEDNDKQLKISVAVYKTTVSSN